MTITCPAPVPGFSSSASGLQVNFTDVSTSSNSILSWMWDFGDGNTSTQQNPVHTYGAPGTYTVCLTVMDSCGTDSSCQTVTVSCDIVASYTHTTTGLQADFTDASTSSQTILSWMWDFGDGNTSTQQNPSHTYSADGTYTVCLTVMDSCGTDSTCSTVTINSSSIGEWFEAINLYPNPAGDVANIEVVNSTVPVSAITVMDLSGRLVTNVPEAQVSSNVTMDVSGFAQGTYVVRVTFDNGFERDMKLVIKR